MADWVGERQVGGEEGEEEGRSEARCRDIPGGKGGMRSVIGASWCSG